MKHVLLGLAACTWSFVATAQHFQCGTDRMRAELIAADPTYLEREAALEAELQALIRNSSTAERGGDVIITIPIVFHVLHLGGSENITNEQILNQMDLLNQDFRALNVDISSIHPAYDEVYGDAKIQFALPTLDPQGNCTNGIDRVRTPETLRGDDRSKMNPWPRDKYLNVWIAERMRDGVAGYAYYPGAFEGPIQRLADGVIILNDYIGEIGTSNPGRSTALTHEIGHYLNLPHVWGNNNGVEPGGEQAPPGHMVPDCGDDGVSDTPNTRGWDLFCPNYNDPQNGWATDCNAFSMVPLPYTFDAVTTNSGTTDPTARVNPADTIDNVVRERAQMLAFSATGVAGNSSKAEVFAFGGWDEVPADGEAEYAFLPGTINTGKYYSFTIDPNLSDLLYLDSIGFKVSRNTNGIRTFAVRSSVNSFASNLPIRAGGNPNIAVQTGNVAFITSDVELNDVTIYVDPPAGSGYQYTDVPVTFRLYAWNAENANGVARVCANGTSIDLFDRLGGAPQTGGTWTGPSATDGTFDPATMLAGTYTYTLDAGAPCPVYTASVEVTIIDPPAVPSITGNDSFCAGGNTVLTSSSTANNRWSTGQTTPTINLNASNTVTVTVSANGCSSTSAPFVVTAVAASNAGGNDSLKVCSASPAVNLFESVGGTPQPGGIWEGPSAVVDNLYDPASMDPGQYRYIIIGSTPCPNDTALVVVQEIDTTSAGRNGTLSICNNGLPADLFDRLAGAPQAGGVWSGPAGALPNGMYDPLTMDGGSYKYKVELPGCGADSSIVTVSETTSPAIPTITGNNVFCQGGSVQLVSSASTNIVWSPSGVTTPGLTATVAGTYTVKNTLANGCSSTSAPFVLTEQARVNAGGDAELTACEAASDVDLFTALIGTPDAAGTWSGPSTVIDGLYQPASMDPGVYLYVVSGTSPCPNDTASVKVTEAPGFDFTTGIFGVDDVTVYGSTNLIENVENYMEYSYCSKMFTKGQAERMRFALNNATGERNNLWTEDNLRITGVAEGFRASCPPQADFYARTVVISPSTSQDIPFTPTVCTGEQVQFVDNSVGGLPTSWEWTFEGGNPSTSTARNPVVTFDSPGFKVVTLTASNANGSNTKTDGYTILIGGSPNDFTGSYAEGFEETASLFPWVDVNYANNITSWRRTNAFGFASNACVVLNASERNNLDLIDPANGSDYDDFYSPTFDLSGMDEAAFNFRYAYSTSATDLALVTERLEVSISTNCGETWTLLPGGEIETTELIVNGNNPQVPPPTWGEQTMNISAARRVPNVRFRFRFISSETSGNLYLDNINILGAVGIESLSAENFMSLFPNPTNDRFTLAVHGMDKFETGITVTDIRGAVVYSNILRPTNQSMEFSAAELGLANGLYLIRASNEAGDHTQKLMVGK